VKIQRFAGVIPSALSFRQPWQLSSLGHSRIKTPAAVAPFPSADRPKRGTLA